MTEIHWHCFDFEGCPGGRSFLWGSTTMLKKRARVPVLVYPHCHARDQGVCGSRGDQHFHYNPQHGLQNYCHRHKVSSFLFSITFTSFRVEALSLCCEESLQMWKSISSRWYHDFLRGTAACVHTSLEIILWNGSLFVSSCNLIQHTLELQLLLGYSREKFVIPRCTSHCVLLL